MKTIILLLALALPSFGGYALDLTATGTAANGSVPAQAGDCRIELSANSWPSTITATRQLLGNNCDVMIYFNNSQNSLEVYWIAGNAGTGSCVGNPFEIGLGAWASKNIVVRYQHSVAGNSGAGLAAMSNRLEAWVESTGEKIYPVVGAPAPNATGSCTYTSLVGSPSNGLTVGDGSGVDTIKVGYARVYSGLVPAGSHMPTTAPSAAPYTTGCVVFWKFDQSLSDECGGSYSATLTNIPCGGNSCYSSTAAYQLMVVANPKTSDAPSWASWRTQRLGYAISLVGSESWSDADGTDAVTCAWTHQSGPNTPTYSNAAICAPSLTGALSGGYTERLTVTDTTAATAYTDLQFGVRDMDANGVLVQTADEEAFWGKTIAFGYSPLEDLDRLHLYAVGAQTTYTVTATEDWPWTTAGAGTVSYPFSGIGPGGTTGTTLSSGIASSTTTSIDISNASAIPCLASLPCRILVGNPVSGGQEQISICSTTATTGAATLTVCWDGRGVSGNLTQIGGRVNSIPAQAWSNGTAVGAFVVQGTSTSFITDSNRPICPAGAPGPPGAVAYSTGTVTLSGTTVTLSGGTWSLTVGDDGYGHGWIRIPVTYSGGTPGVLIRQIASITDSTHLEIDHAIPAGIDAGSYAYKITSHALYLSLEFVDTTNGSATQRGLWTPMGCESETRAYSIFTHDTTDFNTTTQSGVNYSWKTRPITELSTSGTNDANFYGTGLMAANFYHASGYAPALTLWNYMDEHWAIDPEVGGGTFIGSPLAWGGGFIGAVAQLVFNPSTTLTWDEVARFGTFSENYVNDGCNAADSRDSSYAYSALILASKWDDDLTRRAQWASDVSTLRTREMGCRRTAGEGYAANTVDSFANAFVWNPYPQELTLTNGSTAVTGTGFTAGSAGSAGYCYGVDIITLTVTNGSSLATVASGTLTQQTMLWFYDGTHTGAFEYTVSGSNVQLSGVWTGSSGTYSAMSTLGGLLVSGGQQIGGFAGIWTGNTDTYANNIALQKAWQCKYNNSGSLTLFRPWDGPTTGANHYYISYYNIGTFGQQPFMTGIKANELRWGSTVADAGVAADFLDMYHGLGNWFASYGWDGTSLTRGTLYNVIYDACGSPLDVAAGSFPSIHNYQGCGATDPTINRTNSFEAMAAMIPYYAASPSSGTKALVDNFWVAPLADSNYCAAAVLSLCDNLQSDHATEAYMQGPKWTGFEFGMGGLGMRSWAAIRMDPTPTKQTGKGMTFGKGVRF